MSVDPRWTWQAGMLARWDDGSSARVIHTYDAGPEGLLVDLLPRWGWEDHLVQREQASSALDGACPDLEDPATLGCLLVQEYGMSAAKDVIARLQGEDGDV